MSAIVEDVLFTVELADLAPTQMTVGMREVDLRRRRWREKHGRDAANYLDSHRIPVVLGPDGRKYLIDRHHLTLALFMEGVLTVPVSIVACMGRLALSEFWATLERRRWTHPFDAGGQRRPFEDMPSSLAQLVDDPFRSLAGAVKRAGGYAKHEAPFSEFLWANYLRSLVPRELIERDFGRALALAMDLVQQSGAAALPGWRRHPEH